MTERTTPDPNELAEVLASIEPTPIQIARDLLEGAGIKCFMFDEGSSRMLGSTSAIPSRLMVSAEDAPEARRRLKDLGFTD